MATPGRPHGLPIRARAAGRVAQQLQQTGMLFIIMQQVQPAFIMALQHSPHAWIIAAHSLSPLVQVQQTPFSVISHLHIPIIRLQQQTIIPFIIVQRLHMPPAIMVQRFWSIPADVASSLVQVIFMPPVHFSIFIVQRGTIIMFMPAGIGPVPPIIGVPMAGLPMAGMPIPARSISLLVMSIAPGCRVKTSSGFGAGPESHVRSDQAASPEHSGGHCGVLNTPASSRLALCRGPPADGPACRHARSVFDYTRGRDRVPNVIPGVASDGLARVY
jgi:hypothetical protein